jgi:hypothetical protein
MSNSIDHENRTPGRQADRQERQFFFFLAILACPWRPGDLFSWCEGSAMAAVLDEIRGTCSFANP